MMCRRGNFGRMLTGDFNGDKQPDLLTIGIPFSGPNRENRASLYLNVVENYQHRIRPIEPPKPPPSSVQEAQLSTVSIKVNSNRVTVSGAANQIASVYTTTGILIQNEVLKSNATSFAVNAPAGIYIVKVGSAVQKVFLK